MITKVTQNNGSKITPDQYDSTAPKNKPKSSMKRISKGPKAQ